MSPWSSEFIRQTDEALTVAFMGDGIPVPERLAHLEQVEGKIDRLIDFEEEKYGELSGAAYYGYATLCYLPSIEHVAAGRRHELELASLVSENFQLLAGKILENEALDHADSDTKGFLSEVGVLSQLWWGIANGHAPEYSYATFTTIDKNRSSQSGLRDGTDIIMRQAGKNGRVDPIQVKYSPRKAIYAPGIAVISPKDLVEGVGRDSALKTLFKAIRDNDLETLSEGFLRAEDLMEQARREKIADRIANLRI